MTLCLTLPLILAGLNEVVLVENFGIGIALFFYFTYEHGGKDMAIFHMCNNRTSLQLTFIATLY